MTHLKTGDVAPNFKLPSHLDKNVTLSDLRGVRHSLSEHVGKVLLVNLWATWCPPCTAEMPIFQRFYEAHRLEGFVVIAINDGEPAADVDAFIEDHGLSFPVWLDPTYEATDRAFKAANLPTTYIIDRGGRVRLMWIGAISAANLDRYVTPLIKE